MRKSIIASTILHIVLFLMAWIGLPQIMEPLPPPQVIIPIEITDIGALTNTRIKDKPEPPKPPQPRPARAEPKPAPKPPQPKPPEPKSPVETPKPEPKPVEEKQDIKPEKQEDEAEALLKKKQPEKKKPEKPKPKPPQTDQLSSVLKNLAKLKNQVKVDDKKPEVKTTDAPEPQSDAPSISDRLSISEEDALRRQIQRCWNMPVGARDADKLVVEILIQVNPDRTVQSAEVVDMSRLSDPFYRAAAESALRAVRNPRCNPLELPADKYDQWKTIRFNFDPRDML